MRAIRKDGSFFVPKGALAYPRDARNRESSASGAARRRGILSFSKKSIPSYPREKGRGAFPLDPAALAVLGLKSYAACGIGCGVRGFATGPYVRHHSQPRLTTVRRE